MMIPDIQIENYNYALPDDMIAKYPLAERDSSKLLRYRDGVIDEFVFRQIPELLPSDSIIVFNDTKVVPARLHFERSTGAQIEVFILEPVEHPEDYYLTFSATEKCAWKCIVGNSKRWKDEPIHLINPYNNQDIAALDLTAVLLSKDGATGIVEFQWKTGCSFSKMLELCGSIPIPPYLGRDTEEIDLERYQTTYAHHKGSVAAPTAGLHFTPEVLERITNKGINRETLCLHVGAGTFLPVKCSNVAEHPMHREPIAVKKTFIEEILNSKKKIIAVGTTSVRTLESLYYVGVSIIEKGVPEEVQQWDPYTREYSYTTEDALRAIVKYLEDNDLNKLRIGTRIIIVPGFKFRLVDVLITNFHQPESTLLLLVSAFVAEDWKSIYRYAISHQFRFLSYGDSSLIFRRD